MSNATELLKRALEALHFDLSAKESAKVAEEIRAFLAAEPEAEPIYLARRKGLADFFTCLKDRYDELAAHDLFETKIVYLHPPGPEPETKAKHISDESLRNIKQTLWDFICHFNGNQIDLGKTCNDASEHIAEIKWWLE